MNIVPSTPEPSDDRPAELLHPSWCSPAHCTSPERLAERGVDEADVPRWMQGAHLSEPIVVGSTLDHDPHAEARFTLQAWRWVYQPPTEAVDGIDVTIEALERHHRMTTSVSPFQMPQLVEAFIAMRDLATSSAGGRIGEPRSVWSDRAIRALAAFGALGRAEAERLLPSWRFRGEMSEADVAITLAWFSSPAGGVE